MIRSIISLLAATTVFLAGCTMIPTYTRPEAPVPQNWPNGPAYPETGAPQAAPIAADLQWRQFVTDKRLQTIIDTALANNRDLRVAALNVARVRALYRIQRAELLPTIDAGAGGSRQRVSPDLSRSGASTTRKQFSADLSISAWEIDFFGRIRSLEKRALEEYLATEQARRSAQILLVSEVANTYLTLAADLETLQLARSTFEAQQSTYNLVKRRFDIGIAPELDLWQAQTRVDAARVDVARYTELAAQAKNALDLLAGLTVPAVLLPEGLSGIEPFAEVSPGTSSEVLLLRPDILGAENRLKAANASIGAARAAFFPAFRSPPPSAPPAMIFPGCSIPAPACGITAPRS